MNTLKITAGALLIGVVIGIIVAAIRSSYDKNKDTMKLRGGIGYRVLAVINAICKVYLTVVRGTPVVVQLLIAYFLIFQSSTNGVMVASIAFGINSGAYVAEIIRAGILAVDKGQMEAGRALGLTNAQTMVYIIIPQAIKNVLPPLGNEFIVLIKETSVAGVIAVTDLTKAAQYVGSATWRILPPLYVAAGCYLIMVLGLTKLLNIFERRLAQGDHN